MNSKYHIFTRKILPALLLTFLVGTFVSCRKEAPQINDPQRIIVKTFNDVFESFWGGMNNNYIFWDTDPTDWDAVYKKYKPLFAQLDIDKEEDHLIAYSYFEEMTANLIDSHYNIQFTSPPLNMMDISPSRNRHMKADYYHNPIPGGFFYEDIPNNYLDAGAVKSVDINNGETFIAIAGKINQDILYFHFNSFKFTDINAGNYAPNAKKVLDYYLNALKDHSNLKGLIIDLRSNSGGQTADLNLLFGPLTDKAYVFASTRGKAGLNRLDYTPWIEAKVSPTPDAKAFTAPIVVLADLHSISMAEMSTMALKTLPSSPATFVGERTWGGVGPLVANMDFQNSGQFHNSFFKSVYTSTWSLKYIDGVNYEGIGFPPDVEVKYNKNKLMQGIDEQLEKAISIIRK